MCTLVQYARSEQNIPAFTTDGCSSFPDGSYTSSDNSLEWRHCCIIHDLDYYAGGSELAKNKADSELSTCVDKAIGVDDVPVISLGVPMYLGVQIGGLPKFLMFKSIAGFRWGHGVLPNQGFFPNSNQQQELLIQRLNDFKEEFTLSHSNEKYELIDSQKSEILEFVNKKINFMGKSFYKSERYKNTIEQ